VEGAEPSEPTDVRGGAGAPPSMEWVRRAASWSVAQASVPAKSGTAGTEACATFDEEIHDAR